MLLSLNQVVIGYPRGQRLVENKEHVIDYLLENNLTYGYSLGFDYARQLSVISNEETTVNLVLYPNETGNFSIESLYTFEYEREKPKDVNEFFIIIPKDFIRNLDKKDENFYKIINYSVYSEDIDDCVVYVFNIKDFDTICTFEE